MPAEALAEPRNRYANVPQQDDFTIDQNWQSYSTEEHDRWDRLFARQSAVLKGRACQEFLDALNVLELSRKGIPDFEILSDRLEAITGWRVVAVPGLVPDELFFDHLANRRFPSGAFIRPESELDYLEEPDIFHDVFGHVPLLANPVYADFLQAYGEGGQRALNRGQLNNLARLYWYTVEFGLIRSNEGLRIFGAGILSSPSESIFSLEDESPHRITFDIGRIMRTEYIIDDFQKTYFVISSFSDLLNDCYQDFGPLYDRLKGASSILPHETISSDKIINRGSQHYFLNKAKS